MYLALSHPSTMMVVGPSKCGKTTFVIRAIREGLFEPKSNRIVWAFSMWQPGYEDIAEEIPNIEFIEGIDALTTLEFNPHQNNLIVLDDLMSEAGDSKQLSHLFTRGSHHSNLTVIYLVQNLFHKGRAHRDCSLNTNYIVLFDNPRDRMQPIILGRQMFPNKNGARFIQEALRDARSADSYGYLLFDLHADTPEDIRIRTRIFPHEETIVYKPDDESGEVENPNFKNAKKEIQSNRQAKI